MFKEVTGTVTQKRPQDIADEPKPKKIKKKPKVVKKRRTRNKLVINDDESLNSVAEKSQTAEELESVESE